MALRKINLTIKFIVDTEQENLTLSKFDSYIQINNIGTGKVKASDLSSSINLSTLITTLMNRWNQNKTNSFTLTQSQWNQLKAFLQSLEDNN